MKTALESVIRARLWEVVDRHGWVVSATLTGSFVEAPCLEAVGDIDLVVVVDRLNEARFTALHREFDDALRPLFAEAGYDFRINATLGPLKCNGPRLAVLHLMLYSRAAHAGHAGQSPFTCLDWQRSPAVRKRPLAEVYPVFGLQPRHFLGARRGARDYLRDLRAGAISYRELVCTEGGYREERRSKPMSGRDRHEFAYHVMRFLMQNALKLLTRRNEALPARRLTNDYFAAFPDGAERFASFFHALAAKKAARDFAEPLPGLHAELEAFVATFEAQFRPAFFETATRHLVFRHAPTPFNAGAGEGRVFQGRTDPDLAPADLACWRGLAEAVAELTPGAAFSSPLLRARRSLERLADLCPLPGVRIDSRLSEIDYGALEGLTVAAARAQYPGLFAAWARGEDPRLPGGGESSADVTRRALNFAQEVWRPDAGNTVSCAHNVVLRCLVGSTLGVPPAVWHRLRVPHLAPVTFVRTREHGLFVDIPEEAERALLASWGVDDEGQEA